MSEIELRTLPSGQLHRIGELDRSERVDLGYRVEDGRLLSQDVDWNVAPWTPEGDGEHSLSHQMAFCAEHLAQGGVAIGAFDGSSLVGLGVVRPNVAADTAQLAFLHVSRAWRRRAVASRLLQSIIEQARTWQARFLYVSATPSASAVGFYQRHDFDLVQPIPSLLELEPDDIHMILVLDDR